MCVTKLESAIKDYCSMLPNLKATSAMDYKRLYKISYEAYKANEDVTLEQLVNELKNNSCLNASEDDIKEVAICRLKEILHAKEILFFLRAYIQ